MQFHSVITNENLKTYVPKERKWIGEGNYQGKETLQRWFKVEILVILQKLGFSIADHNWFADYWQIWGAMDIL